MFCQIDDMVSSVDGQLTYVNNSDAVVMISTNKCRKTGGWQTWMDSSPLAEYFPSDEVLLCWHCKKLNCSFSVASLVASFMLRCRLTAIHVRHDSPNWANIDDASLSFNQQRMKGVYHSHWSKNVDIKHLSHLVHIRVDGGHCIACNLVWSRFGWINRSLQIPLWGFC